MVSHEGFQHACIRKPKKALNPKNSIWGKSDYGMGF
jgi:hypothetical protein